MPLLDSFKVDHTKMNAPAVRIAKTMRTPKGDNITVFDLRFCIPNKEILSPKGIHTLEHLFAGFMRDHLNGDSIEIIDISPMGCRTGFYMSLIGTPNEQEVSEAWLASMQDEISKQEKTSIPEKNIYNSGRCFRGTRSRFYSRIKYLSMRKLYGTFLRRCTRNCQKCYRTRYRCK